MNVIRDQQKCKSVCIHLYLCHLTSAIFVNNSDSTKSTNDILFCFVLNFALVSPGYKTNPEDKFPCGKTQIRK